jgi:hypothetical protein
LKVLQHFSFKALKPRAVNPGTTLSQPAPTCLVEHRLAVNPSPDSNLILPLALPRLLPPRTNTCIRVLFLVVFGAFAAAQL